MNIFAAESRLQPRVISPSMLPGSSFIEYSQSLISSTRLNNTKLIQNINKVMNVNNNFDKVVFKGLRRKITT